jgi:hypothetical protein
MEMTRCRFLLSLVSGKTMDTQEKMTGAVGELNTKLLGARTWRGCLLATGQGPGLGWDVLLFADMMLTRANVRSKSRRRSPLDPPGLEPRPRNPPHDQHPDRHPATTHRPPPVRPQMQLSQSNIEPAQKSPAPLGIAPPTPAKRRVVSKAE